MCVVPYSHVVQATETCSEASTQCRNTGGSYFCECLTGFQALSDAATLLNQVACADINECEATPEVKNDMCSLSCGFMLLTRHDLSSSATRTLRASTRQVVSPVPAIQDSDPLAQLATAKTAADCSVCSNKRHLQVSSLLTLA